MATNAAIPSDAGTNRGVYDSLEAIRSLIIPGETIEAMAIQRRAFALRHRRKAVAATTGRLIIVQRRLFGGYTPVDIRWQDLHESALQVGMLGATLTVSAYANQSDLAISEGAASGHIVSGLRKVEAQEVYRICQARAQAWREKRRIRELEEMRARAGGIQVGALGGGAGSYGMTPGNGADQSLTARLQRAKEMRESGLLTDTEFEQIKAKILAEL